MTAALKRSRKPASVYEGAIPWTERPVLNIPTAAELLGCSPATIYAFANAGELELVRLAGRTSVRTESIKKMIREAKAWTPDLKKNSGAVKERRRLAAARLSS